MFLYFFLLERTNAQKEEYENEINKLLSERDQITENDNQIINDLNQKLENIEQEKNQFLQVKKFELFFLLLTVIYL